MLIRQLTSIYIWQFRFVSVIRIVFLCPECSEYLLLRNTLHLPTIIWRMIENQISRGRKRCPRY